MEWGGRHAIPRDENFLREGGGGLRLLSSVCLSAGRVEIRAAAIWVHRRNVLEPSSVVQTCGASTILAPSSKTLRLCSRQPHLAPDETLRLDLRIDFTPVTNSRSRGSGNQGRDLELVTGVKSISGGSWEFGDSGIDFTPVTNSRLWVFAIYVRLRNRLYSADQLKVLD